MLLNFWAIIGFLVVLGLAFWSIGRWSIPRLKIGGGALDMTEAELRQHIADLERRLSDSEAKNIELTQTQDFLLVELKKSNTMASQQEIKIVELTNKVHELERNQNNAQPQGRERFNVLGIWPDGTPLLDQQAEADALYNAGYDYKALRGKEASRSGILRELERYKPNIWEIGAHGDETGIMLSDGIARPGWWGQIAKASRPVAAVLMACRSNQQDRINVADALIGAGVKNVVACDQDILDADATKFVSLFYERLATGASFKDAAERAKLAVSDAGREQITVR